MSYAFTASGAKAAVGRRPGLGDKGSSLLTPHKKLFHRPLADVEKDCNRAHSSIRSAVEHCIGHLESWKILSEDYRGPLDRFAEAPDTTVQLELLRTWSPPSSTSAEQPS